MLSYNILSDGLLSGNVPFAPLNNQTESPPNNVPTTGTPISQAITTQSTSNTPVGIPPPESNRNDLGTPAPAPTTAAPTTAEPTTAAPTTAAPTTASVNPFTNTLKKLENFVNPSTSTSTSTSSTSSEDSNCIKKKLCNKEMILNIILFGLIIYVLYLLTKDNTKDDSLGGLSNNNSFIIYDDCN